MEWLSRSLLTRDLEWPTLSRPRPTPVVVVDDEVVGVLDLVVVVRVAVGLRALPAFVGVLMVRVVDLQVRMVLGGVAVAQTEGVAPGPSAPSGKPIASSALPMIRTGWSGWWSSQCGSESATIIEPAPEATKASAVPSTRPAWPPARS